MVGCVGYDGIVVSYAPVGKMPFRGVGNLGCGLVSRCGRVSWVSRGSRTGLGTYKRIFPKPCDHSRFRVRVVSLL